MQLLPPSAAVAPLRSTESLLTVGEILIAYHRGPASYQEVCAAISTPVKYNTVSRVTRLLWEHRVIRVARWSKTPGGGYQRAFAVGAAPDRPQPDGDIAWNSGAPNKRMAYVEAFVAFWRALQEPVDVTTVAPRGESDTYLRLARRLQAAGLLEVTGVSEVAGADPGRTQSAVGGPPFNGHPTPPATVVGVLTASHMPPYGPLYRPLYRRYPDASAQMDADLTLREQQESAAQEAATGSRRRSMYAANNSVFGYAQSVTVPKPKAGHIKHTHTPTLAP